LRVIDLAKNALERVGFKVTRFPPPYSLPWQIRRVLEHEQINGIVDVGAHEGEFVRLARRVVGFKGPVSSYEPSAASYELLRQRMAGDPMWTGHRMALGAKNSELELNVYPESVFNSFLTPNVLGRGMFAPELNAGWTTESAPVRRLDDVLDLGGTLLLKVDTQGFDMQVIEGAAGVLDRVAAILVEVPIRPIYDDAPDVIDILRQMADWGYELLGLFPVTRDPDYFRVIEFDGVFVRADAPWRQAGSSMHDVSAL
jgi:FkbM family methyltransferase